MLTGEDVGLLMMLAVIGIGTPVVLFFYWLTERKNEGKRPPARMTGRKKWYNPFQEL